MTKIGSLSEGRRIELLTEMGRSEVGKEADSSEGKRM